MPGGQSHDSCGRLIPAEDLLHLFARACGGKTTVWSHPLPLVQLPPRLFPSVVYTSIDNGSEDLCS
jgi:hypothetical protein